MQFKDASWSYDDELRSLRRDLKLIADQCRSDETKKMINSIERNVKKQLSEPVEVSLSKPSERMWDNLMITFKAVLARAEKVYMARAKSEFALGSAGVGSRQTHLISSRSHP
jgi:hypothetical protein